MQGNCSTVVQASDLFNICLPIAFLSSEPSNTSGFSRTCCKIRERSAVLTLTDRQLRIASNRRFFTLAAEDAAEDIVNKSQMYKSINENAKTTANYIHIGPSLHACARRFNRQQISSYSGKRKSSVRAHVYTCMLSGKPLLQTQRHIKVQPAAGRSVTDAFQQPASEAHTSQTSASSHMMQICGGCVHDAWNAQSQMMRNQRQAAIHA
jgi:hypothetical protein